MEELQLKLELDKIVRVKRVRCVKRDVGCGDEEVRVIQKVGANEIVRGIIGGVDRFIRGVRLVVRGARGVSKRVKGIIVRVEEVVKIGVIIRVEGDFIIERRDIVVIKVIAVIIEIDLIFFRAVIIIIIVEVLIVVRVVSISMEFFLLQSHMKNYVHHF